MLSLQNRVAACFNILLRHFIKALLMHQQQYLHVLAAMFNDCVIKTISSDAKSREEQDGSKYSFVGRTTAELQAILHVCVTKNTEKKRRPKICLAEKGSFPCKLR